MTNSIQVRGLRVTRSGREVLHGIDADLPAGQSPG